MAVSRPAGVTLVAVLAWISGIINIIGGILVLTDVLEAGVSDAAAWTLIVVGAIVFLVSLGLFRGSNAARVLTTLAFLANIAFAIFTLAATGGTNVSALVSGFTSLIGLILLYTGRANDFFRG